MKKIIPAIIILLALALTSSSTYACGYGVDKKVWDSLTSTQKVVFVMGTIGGYSFGVTETGEKYISEKDKPKWRRSFMLRMSKKKYTSISLAPIIDRLYQQPEYRGWCTVNLIIHIISNEL